MRQECRKAGEKENRQTGRQAVREAGSRAGKKERRAGRKREADSQLWETGCRQGTADRMISGIFSEQELLNSNMSGMTHRVSDTVT